MYPPASQYAGRRTPPRPTTQPELEQHDVTAVSFTAVLVARLRNSGRDRGEHHAVLSPSHVQALQRPASARQSDQSIPRQAGRGVRGVSLSLLSAATSTAEPSRSAPAPVFPMGLNYPRLFMQILIQPPVVATAPHRHWRNRPPRRPGNATHSSNLSNRGPKRDGWFLPRAQTLTKSLDAS
jgi:hypothetical protein